MPGQASAPIVTAEPLVRALFALARHDLQVHLPPGMLAEGDTLERGRGYTLYRAGKQLNGDHLLTPRERAAREVCRLVGLLNVHEQVHQAAGLNIPAVPAGYSGGDALLDAVVAGECREGLELLVRGAISAYLECLGPSHSSRFRVLALTGKHQEFTVKPLQRERDAYSNVLHEAIEQHVVETGRRPKPKDILQRWSASPPDPILRVTPQGAKYIDWNGQESLLARDRISKTVHHYCEESERAP